MTAHRPSNELRPSAPTEPAVITLAVASGLHRGCGALVRLPGKEEGIEVFDTAPTKGLNAGQLTALEKVVRAVPMDGMSVVVVGQGAVLQQCVRGFTDPRARQQAFDVLTGAEAACYRRLLGETRDISWLVLVKLVKQPLAHPDGKRAHELAQIATLSGQRHAPENAREARIAVQKERKAARRAHAKRLREKTRAEIQEAGGRTNVRRREPPLTYAEASGR